MERSFKKYSDDFKTRGIIMSLRIINVKSMVSLSDFLLVDTVESNKFIETEAPSNPRSSSFI